MSLNLYFEIVDKSGCVDFPFQTPTDLTLKVYNERSTEKKLRLIEDFLYECRWDTIAIHETLKKIERQLKSKHLKLSYC